MGVACPLLLYTPGKTYQQESLPGENRNAWLESREVDSQHKKLAMQINVIVVTSVKMTEANTAL